MLGLAVAGEIVSLLPVSATIIMKKLQERRFFPPIFEIIEVPSVPSPSITVPSKCSRHLARCHARFLDSGPFDA